MGRVEGEDGLQVLSDEGVSRLAECGEGVEGWLCPDGGADGVGGP